MRKKKTLAAARRFRVRFNIACSVLVLAVLATGAVALARLMPYHGQWEYENRREWLELPAITEPSCLEVLIRYAGEAPQGFELSHDGARLRKTSQDPDPESKSVTIWSDVGSDEAGEGRWDLSLVPMDNYELQYEINVVHSYEHPTTDIRFYRSEDGHMWVYAEAWYYHLREDGKITISVGLEGASYMPTIVHRELPGEGGSFRIDLTQAILERKARLADASSIKCSVLAQGEDRNGDAMPVNEHVSVRIRDFPAYDGSLELPDAPDITEEYLDEAIPRRKELREKAEAEAAAASEDSDTAPEDGAQ